MLMSTTGLLWASSAGHKSNKIGRMPVFFMLVSAQQNEAVTDVSQYAFFRGMIDHFALDPHGGGTAAVGNLNQLDGCACSFLFQDRSPTAKRLVVGMGGKDDRACASGLGEG